MSEPTTSEPTAMDPTNRPTDVQHDLDSAAHGPAVPGGDGAVGAGAGAEPQGRPQLGVSDTATDVVDLMALGAQLLDRARAGGTGRAVRAVVRQPGQSLILLALPAGGGLPDHDAPGPASLQCLTGEVVLVAGDREWALPAGRAVLIPQERHEVRALADSLCLLAVSLPLPA